MCRLQSLRILRTKLQNCSVLSENEINRNETEYGTTSFLVPDAVSITFHDWCRGGHHQTKRDRHVHVYRAHAQCRESDIRRVCEFFPGLYGPTVRLYCYDSGCRGGSGWFGNHYCHLP